LIRTFSLRFSIPFLLLVSASCASAQSSAASTTIRIIPQPRQAIVNQEVFRIGAGARIILADPGSEEDRFAAQDFIDDAKETASVSLIIGKGRARPAIVIGTLDQPLVQSALKRVALESPANLDPEGYVLNVSAGEVIVGGKSAAGVFYGMQTLKQLVQGEASGAFIQGARITDWPALRWRAVSDDISRGPVPTIEYIKRQLRTEAMFKLNMHSFYMEHTFAAADNPLIGPAGGSLTAGEIRELVTYAKRYHIELVPEQQTFGHLHKALRLEKYSELAETPSGTRATFPQQTSLGGHSHA
jgi:N-acetyl-beta-hexosaminidase